MSEFWETLDQLIMPWIVWNWFTMSTKMKYFPWRRKDWIRPTHGEEITT